MPTTIFILPVEVQTQILSHVCGTDLSDGSRALPLYRGKIMFKLWDNQTREIAGTLARISVAGLQFMKLTTGILGEYERLASERAWVPRPALYKLRTTLERWMNQKEQGLLARPILSAVGKDVKRLESKETVEVKLAGRGKTKGNAKNKGKGNGKKVVLLTIGAGR